MRHGGEGEIVEIVFKLNHRHHGDCAAPGFPSFVEFTTLVVQHSLGQGQNSGASGLADLYLDPCRGCTGRGLGTNGGWGLKLEELQA